jgi:two-component system LytT family response regulator
MPLRIFIVDDEPVALERLEQTLAGLEEVEIAGVAGTAEAALPLILDVKPDIVLLDIEMPGMNGLEFCRVLRDASTTEVVFVTAMV